MEWVFRHIKGHQDYVAEEDLDRCAHLNIERNIRSKAYIAEIFNGYNTTKYVVPIGLWVITIFGTFIDSNIMRYLRRCINGAKMFEYWVM